MELSLQSKKALNNGVYLISLLIIIAVLFILTVLNITNSNKELNVNDVRIGFWFLGLGTLIFSINLKSVIKNNYLLFSIIFIVGFLIVHFQLYLDFLLGYKLPYFIKMFDITSVKMRGFYISILALFSYILGYLISIKLPKKLKLERKKNLKINNNSIVLSIIIFIFFLIYIVSSDFSYFKGSYGKVDNNYIALYFEYFLKLAIIASIINTTLVVKYEGITLNIISFIRRINLLTLFILLIYSLLVISSGDRGPVIQIVMAIIVGYIYSSEKKVSFLQISFLGIAAISLLFILGISREFTGSSNLSIKKIIEAKKSLKETGIKVTVSPVTREYATVLRAHHGGILYVANKGYHYGELTFYNMVGALPGFGRLYQLISQKQDRELKSSQIITDFLYKEDPNGHGLGTTCIVDIFLDFGILGVYIVFLTFGFYSWRIDRLLIDFPSYTLFWFILSFTFIVNSYYIPRSSISSLFRDGLIIYILIKLSIIFSKQKHLLKVINQ